MTLRQVFCNVQNNLKRFIRIWGVVDGHPVLGGVADELLEIPVEMLDDLCTDGVRLLPTLPPIGQGGKSGDAPGHTAFGVGVQRRLKRLICKRFADPRPELISVHCSLPHWSLIRQHFRNMHNLLRLLLSVQSARDVHTAA